MPESGELVVADTVDSPVIEPIPIEAIQDDIDKTMVVNIYSAWYLNVTIIEKFSKIDC